MNGLSTPTSPISALAILCPSRTRALRFLNENGESAAAWRWRAVDGVITSYSAQWNDDAGRTESHQTEWSQANDLLTSSLSHASLLPPSDVTVVRQRLQVVNAQLGR